MEDNKIIVTDGDGKDYEMTILFTYEDDESAKKYVFYFDEKADEGEVFVSGYTEAGELIPVEDEAEWAMLNKVLEDWQKDNDDEDDA